jgi:hypothetical protein
VKRRGWVIWLADSCWTLCWCPATFSRRRTVSQTAGCSASMPVPLLEQSMAALRKLPSHHGSLLPKHSCGFWWHRPSHNFSNSCTGILPPQPRAALDDPVAVSTRARGEARLLVTQPMACDWCKHDPSFARGTAVIGAGTLASPTSWLYKPFSSLLESAGRHLLLLELFL